MRKRLKGNLKISSSDKYLRHVNTQGTNITQATYRIVYNLGKTSRVVEIIADGVIIEVVSCLDIDKVNKYKKLHLSRQTTTDRQHELALNVSSISTQYAKAKTFATQLPRMSPLVLTIRHKWYFFIRIVTSDFQCCD